MDKIKTSFTNGAVCEVRKFNYELGGYLMAEIEIMAYSETEFRAQARMFATGQSVTVRGTYSVIEQALDGIVAEIEKTISQNHGLEEKAS